MRKTALFLTLVALAAAGCHRGARGVAGVSQQSTQTIAPAAAKPASAGTDAITQTVEIEDSRSEEDGGTLTRQTTTTATAKTPAKAPSRKKGHK